MTGVAFGVVFDCDADYWNWDTREDFDDCLADALNAPPLIEPPRGRLPTDYRQQPLWRAWDDRNIERAAVLCAAQLDVQRVGEDGAGYLLYVEGTNQWTARYSRFNTDVLAKATPARLASWTRELTAVARKIGHTDPAPGWFLYGESMSRCSPCLWLPRRFKR